MLLRAQSAWSESRGKCLANPGVRVWVNCTDEGIRLAWLSLPPNWIFEKLFVTRPQLEDVCPRIWLSKSDFVRRDPQNWPVSAMKILKVVYNGSSKKRQDKREP
jgi:hypothetical protein